MTKHYVNFLHGNVIFGSIVPQSAAMLLTLKLPHKTLKDPSGRCVDIRNVGHQGVGGWQMKVASPDDLDYAVGLAEQAHRFAG